MLCPWCLSEISARKDRSVFFCPECNKPVGFDLNGEFVRIVRVRELYDRAYDTNPSTHTECHSNHFLPTHLPPHPTDKLKQLTWGDLV